MIKQVRKQIYLGTILYFLIYMIWFTFLERNVTGNYTIMHTALDDKIPFSEWFIIPYLLWFVYIAVTFFWLSYHDIRGCVRYCQLLFSGMTVALFICTIFPNGTDLRVAVDPSKNVLCRLVNLVQSLDTSTNVFPSIHVYNALVTHIVLSKNQSLRQRPLVLGASAVLTVLICASTVVLKQHSVVDVAGAVVLVAIMYDLVYRERNESRTGASRKRFRLTYNRGQ